MYNIRIQSTWDKLCDSTSAVIEGVLYRQTNEGEEKDLVLPSSLKEEAIRLNHDLPSAGHQVIARTKARVKEKVYWYKINNDILSHVSTCATCNTPIDSFAVRMRKTPKPYRVILLEFWVKIFFLDKTMAYTCALNNCYKGSYWLKNWEKTV